MDVNKEAKQLAHDIATMPPGNKTFEEQAEILILQSLEKICREQRESDMKHAAYGWREFPLLTDK